MEREYMCRAIELSKHAIEHADCGPFGCVIVRKGEIVGEGFNQVIRRHDPTAHGEVMAIRDACSHLRTHDLHDCELYTSCKPCPMCLGAILWARISVVYFAADSDDAASVGFDDRAFYCDFDTRQPQKHIIFHQVLRREALDALQEWASLPMKASY